MVEKENNLYPLLLQAKQLKDKKESKAIQNKIFTAFYPLIFHFMQRKKQSKDLTHDFYLYLTKQIDSIIKNCPETLSYSFYAWIYQVLSYQFSHFLVEKKKQNASFSFEVSNTIEEYSNIYINDAYYYKEDLTFILRNLPEKEKIILKLLYLPSFIKFEELATLQSFCTHSSIELLDFFKNLIIKETQSKNRQKSILEEIHFLENELEKLIFNIKSYEVDLEKKKLKNKIEKLNWKLHKECFVLKEDSQAFFAKENFQYLLFKLQDKVIFLLENRKQNERKKTYF